MVTEHLNLILNPTNDTDTTFGEYRAVMNGESNSNMTKIDKAFSDMSLSITNIKETLEDTYNKKAVDDKITEAINSSIISALGGDY
jgi:hypothetical protein